MTALRLSGDGQVELDRLRLATVEKAQPRIAFVTVPAGMVLITTGVAGYAYWHATALLGSAVSVPLQSVRSNVYALGPEITAITKYGLYYLASFSEFDAAGT